MPKVKVIIDTGARNSSNSLAVTGRTTVKGNSSSSMAEAQVQERILKAKAYVSVLRNLEGGKIRGLRGKNVVPRKIHCDGNAIYSFNVQREGDNYVPIVTATMGGFAYVDERTRKSKVDPLEDFELDEEEIYSERDLSFGDNYDVPESDLRVVDRDALEMRFSTADVRGEHPSSKYLEFMNQDF